MSGKTFKGKGKGGIKDLDRDFIKGDSILKSCFSQLPSYDLLIPALLEHGIFDLEKHCRLTPGIRNNDIFLRFFCSRYSVETHVGPSNKISWRSVGSF